MSTTLLFQPFSAVIDTLTLDASVKEDHVADVDVTDHPVEKGANVTDHARLKPVELTIEGVVSNTPLNHVQTRQATIANGVSVQTTAITESVRGQPGWAESAYLTLRDLRDNPRLITIITALRTYDDMILTSLRVPRDKDTGDALQFTATFKNVRLVTNATTVVATKQPKAKPKVKKGQSTTTFNAPQPSGSDKALSAVNTMTQSGAP